jgi:teichuronic acid biosynthesis glycosyltransferase TuaG
MRASLVRHITKVRLSQRSEVEDVVNVMQKKILNDADSVLTAPNGLVSVVMPCRNASSTLEAAIESVLSQDYGLLELIIVDDESSDRSLEIATRFQDKDGRVRLARNRCHPGVANARNTGLRLAAGQFICFLDADDYLLPGSISARVNALRRIDCVVTYGSYYRLVGGVSYYLKRAPSLVKIGDMRRRNCIGNLTGMYDASVLGKFFQHDFVHEDYLMWCEVVARAGVAVSCGASPIAVYRVSSASLSGNKWNSFLWHWRALRGGLSLPFLEAVCCQALYALFSIADRVKERIFARRGVVRSQL